MFLGTYLTYKYKDPKLMMVLSTDFVPLPAAARLRPSTTAAPPKAAPVVHDTAVSNMIDYKGQRPVFRKLTADTIDAKQFHDMNGYKRVPAAYYDYAALARNALVRKGERGRTRTQRVSSVTSSPDRGLFGLSVETRSSLRLCPTRLSV